MHTACLTSNFISFIPSAGTGGRNLCKSYMAVQPSFSLIFISFYTIYLLQRILPSFFIFLPWLPCHFYRPSSNKQNSLKKNSCSPVKKNSVLTVLMRTRIPKLQSAVENMKTEIHWIEIINIQYFAILWQEKWQRVLDRKNERK